MAVPTNTIFKIKKQNCDYFKWQCLMEDYKLLPKSTKYFRPVTENCIQEIVWNDCFSESLSSFKKMNCSLKMAEVQRRGKEEGKRRKKKILTKRSVMFRTNLGKTDYFFPH